MPRKFMVIGVSDEPRGIGRAVSDHIRTFMSADQGDEIVNLGKHAMDVRQPGRVRDWIHDERPDHVVYCAGVNRLDWLRDIKRHEYHEVMEVNVWGFVSVMQAMSREGILDASIVAVSSDAAQRPMRTSLAYCASKAALDMAVRVAAREMAILGSWRVNAVSPGKVENTPMSDYVDARVMELRHWTKDEADAREAASWVLGRPVYADEVAATVWSVLTGPTALNGQIVTVNGGR